MNRRIVEVTRGELPKMAEENCPNWNDGVCRKTGEKCDFSTCPLVDRIADGNGR